MCLPTALIYSVEIREGGAGGMAYSMLVMLSFQSGGLDSFL